MHFMSDEELSPFGMNTYDGQYQVVDGSGRIWLETSNAVTTEHYVDLLSKAFKSTVSIKLVLISNRLIRPCTINHSSDSESLYSITHLIRNLTSVVVVPNGFHPDYRLNVLLLY